MKNEEQIAYWNGDAGRKWAQRDAMMSRMLAPVAEALMEHAQVDTAKAVLDVGCGGGSETLMLAKRLGPEACVLQQRFDPRSLGGSLGGQIPERPAATFRMLRKYHRSP